MSEELPIVEKKTCLVARGIPGAGKSTLLSKRAPNALVCSADHFFIGADGKYVFDASKLRGAHESSFNKFRLAVAGGAPMVAVDNTNLTWWEMGRYVELALGVGYQVEVLDVQTPPDVAAARGIHGVPAEHVQKMARKKLEVPENVRANPNFKYTTIK